MNYLKHFKKILIHKFWVCRYCFAAGLYRRGITHDLSKFSPKEFIESAKYYQGDSSPIEAAKAENGYSIAWMHHKGRNTHHYEYWQDNFDQGGQPIQMPYEDALELVCDYLGAGKAYQGKNFTYQGEYRWWIDKKSKPLAMHPNTLKFVDRMLEAISRCNNLSPLKKKCSKRIYDAIDNASVA